MKSFKVGILCWVFLAIPFADKTASAAKLFEADLIQPPVLSAPKAGFIGSRYSSFAPQADDLVTGALPVSMPMSLPEERGPLLVDIVPVYRANQGLTEWGQGWQQNLTIQRYKEMGEIEYSKDDFTSPWGILLKGNDGFFYPKGLTARIRIEKSVDEELFTAYMPDGRIFKFGSRNRIITEKGVYAWLLTEATDKVGHRTVLSYEANDSGRLFLKEVTYGGREKAQYKVQLAYSQLKKPMATETRSGRELTLDRTVETVSLHVLGHQGFKLRWRYTLGFQAMDEGVRLFLTSIQRSFPAGPSETPVTFEYGSHNEAKKQNKFQIRSYLQDVVKGLPQKDFYKQTLSYYDANEDGLLDVERGDTLETFIQSEPGVFSPHGKVDIASMDARCKSFTTPNSNPQLAEGRLLVRFQGLAHPYVHLNIIQKLNGALYETDLNICDLKGNLLHSEHYSGLDGDIKPNEFVKIADINGDAKPDWIKLHHKRFAFRLNESTDSEFKFGPIRTVNVSESPEQPVPNYSIHDMNNDGLPDIVGRGLNGYQVYYNFGDLRFSQRSVFFPFRDITQNIAQIQTQEQVFVDINRDGQMDVVSIDYQTGKTYFWMNAGAEYRAISIPEIQKLPPVASTVRTMDLAGDGADQIIVTTGLKQWRTLALNLPETGLLTRVDDGQGVELRFSYERSVPIPGLLARIPVVTSVKRTAGYGKGAETRIVYADPRLKENGQFLGFASISLESAGRRTQTSFDLSDELGPALLSRASVDDREQDLLKLERTTYKNLTIGGVKSRVKETTAEFYQSSSRRTAGVTTNFNDYDSNLCPSLTNLTDSVDRLVTATLYASSESWEKHIHCFPERETLSGIHSSSELDFEYTTEVSRNEAGQPLKIWTKTGERRVLIEEAVYDESYRLKSVSAPGRGQTNITWHPDFELVEAVQGPDGVIQKVSEFDELSSSPIRLGEHRGPGQWIQRLSYDNRGRLNKLTHSLFDESLSSWLDQYNYIEPGLHKPGILLADGLSEEISGKLNSIASAKLFDGAGRELASTSRVNGSWRLTEIKSFQDDRGIASELFADMSVDDLKTIVGPDLLKGTELTSQEQSLFGNHASSKLWMGSAQSKEKTRWSVGGSGLTNHVELNGKLKGAWELNAFGKITKYTDPKGYDFSYSYDILGRITSITSPDGKSHTRSFNRFGETEFIEHSVVGTIEFIYDDITRFLKKKNLYGMSKALDRSEVLEYDGIGRVISRNFVKGTDSSKYEKTFVTDTSSNQLGYLESVSSQVYRKNFKYRPDKKPTQKSMAWLDGTVVALNLDYYKTGELKRETVSLKTKSGVKASYQKVYEHNSDGQLAKIQFKNGQLHLSYDPKNRLQKAEWDNGQFIEFDFDNNSQILKGYNANGLRPDRYSMHWTYNADGMIEDESYFHPSAGAQSSQYDYDERWYLKSSTGSQTNTYAYNAVGISEKIAGSSISNSASKWESAGVSWLIDDMGRIKQKGDMSFEFGPEGRHRKAVRNGRTVANYEYDENLHLIFKEKIEGPSTYYFEGLITDGSSLLETVKVNGIVVGILVNGNFVFKPHDLRSTAMPDGRDPREWLEAYGIKNGGAIDLAFDYAGLPRDSDTGWIIMGARFYEPPLGRFLTPDPLLLEDLEKCAENPSECNLYSYARNNPLKYTDPSGLCTVGCHPEHQGPVTYRDGDPQLVGKTWDRLNNAAAEYLAISSYAAQSHDPAASLRSLRDTFLLSTPLEWSYAAGNGVLRSGAPLSGKQFVKGKENIQSFSTLNEARSAGRTMSGISDNAIDFVQEIGPYKGQVTGRMSPDGRQGWRIDFDESKGFHVNWWNKSEGSKRSQWIYGANKIEGGTVDDFKSLLDHGFPKK